MATESTFADERSKYRSGELIVPAISSLPLLSGRVTNRLSLYNTRPPYAATFPIHRQPFLTLFFSRIYIRRRTIRKQRGAILVSVAVAAERAARDARDADTAVNGCHRAHSRDFWNTRDASYLSSQYLSLWRHRPAPGFMPHYLFSPNDHPSQIYLGQIALPSP